MYIFGRHQRLAKKSDFDAVFTAGKKIITKYFIIYYKANDLGYPRLGLVIAKKKVNKAWQRNKLKRKLRESFRQAALKDFDVVVLPKKYILDVAAIDKSNFYTLWDKICATSG